MHFATAHPIHTAGPQAPAVDRVSAFVRRSGAHDIEQHTAQLQDWALCYDQLDCGRFRGQFTDVRWPGVQLFMEGTTRRLRQRGHLQAGGFAAGLLLHGAGSMSVNGAHSGVGSLLACDATAVDICTPTDCTLIGLVIDGQALREAASRMNEPQLIEGEGMLVSMTPPEAALAPWRDLLLATLRLATEQPERLHDAAFQKTASEALMSGLLTVMTACGDPQVLPPDRRKRLVDRACEMLLAQPDAPPSLFEVCSQVGASPRKLGYCFQEVLGVSPVRYIKAMRLNAVRRELARTVDPEVSVYDVAARWGFWHFGHFSADYKRQFMELPSETLRLTRERGAAGTTGRPNARYAIPLHAPRIV